MQKFWNLGLVTVCVVALVGCAAGTGGQASRTTTPPAGPSVAASDVPGVIPAGTELSIRTNESITSDKATPGKTYRAEMANEVIDQSGKVLIPKGSPAALVVVDTSTGGAVGTPQLELALQSVTVGGRNYQVTTATVEQEAERGGLGATRRTATMVGGGALLGTLIGAAAGGGTGAAVGAAVGAAGGAAAQVLTRGKEVRVPAETVMTFKVDQPIQLQGFQR